MGMSELVSRIDYGRFFEEIMKLDQNIRFVASYDGQFNAKFRDGIHGYFNDEEIKSFLSKAQKRWDSRKQMSLKIGDPKFAMAQYDKVNRITIPLDNDGVILVTTEIDIDISKLVTGIIEVRNRFFN
jgi:hypothetical protein